jgi:hypothetical protein
MSTVTQAMIINAVVLTAVLEADLGGHRRIGKLRILRPLLMAATIVPIYLTALATAGTGLTLEIVGAVAGLLLGLVATSAMTVYRSPKTGQPVSRAGLAYAAIWTIVIGARASFSYGANHWFGRQLGTWMGHHSVTADDITNALILMAVAMVLTRTVGMAVRARSTSRFAAPAVEARVAQAATH